MVEQNVSMGRVRASSDAANPSGDFIAMVGSAAAAIFAFLNFFQATGGSLVRGYQTPYGAIVLLAGAACFAFAGVVMVSRFINPKAWMARSPGWMYFLVSSVIIVASVMAMVLGFHGYANEAGPVMTMVTGLFIGFAGMMKF